MRTASVNFRYKDSIYTVDARWDADAKVWIATSNDLPGLVIEAGTWHAMQMEIGLIAPELIELSATR